MMADYSRVYATVAAGGSAEQLRRVLDDCAPRRALSRRAVSRRAAAAANRAGENGETPLQAAHRQRRGDLVGALAEAGADVSGIFGAGRATPLAACIAYGQAESVRALLKAGADPNETIGYAQWLGFDESGSRCTATHFCVSPPTIPASHNHAPPQLACLEVLLTEGRAEVDAADAGGATPLMWLAGLRSRDHDAVEAAARLLLSAGARASGVFDDFGQSPLMMAVSENARLARLLIEEAGAPVDERDPTAGTTALHYCRDGETVDLLLDAGADVDAVDDQGHTPLINAMAIDAHPAAQRLLDRGASPDVVSFNGSTALIEGAQRCHEFSGLTEDYEVDINHADDEDDDGEHDDDNDGGEDDDDGGEDDGDDSDNGDDDDDDGDGDDDDDGDNSDDGDDGDDNERAAYWRLMDDLLRRSSVETRRLVCDSDGGCSAADCLLSGALARGVWDRHVSCRALVFKLLASGTPVLPEHAGLVLPMVAARGIELESALAARLAELGGWRAQETFVGLAMDMRELREDAREVAEKERRVEALKQELRELGAGCRTDDSDGSGGSDGEGGESSSEGESAAAASLRSRAPA